MENAMEKGSRFRTVDLCCIALLAVVMVVCAWVTIPGPVPFTLQTLAVFAALVLLGGRRGTFAILVYLLLGAVGLPVFSGFRGGLGALLGATGGYILGFLAAGLLYWLVTAKLGNRLPAVIWACTLGMGACYAFGTVWFIAVYTVQTGPMSLGGALGACVLPFVPFDALKIALAILLSRKVGKFLN